MCASHIVVFTGWGKAQLQRPKVKQKGLGAAWTQWRWWPRKWKASLLYQKVFSCAKLDRLLWLNRPPIHIRTSSKLALEIIKTPWIVLLQALCLTLANFLKIQWQRTKLEIKLPSNLDLRLNLNRTLSQAMSAGVTLSLVKLDQLCHPNILIWTLQQEIQNVSTIAYSNLLYYWCHPSTILESIF